MVLLGRKPWASGDDASRIAAVLKDAMLVFELVENNNALVALAGVLSQSEGLL